MSRLGIIGSGSGDSDNKKKRGRLGIVSAPTTEGPQLEKKPSLLQRAGQYLKKEATFTVQHPFEAAKTVGRTLAASEKGAAESIAAPLQARTLLKTNEQIRKSESENRQRVISAANKTTDPEKKRRLLALLNRPSSQLDIEKEIPSLKKTPAQVAGEAGGVALDIATAGVGTGLIKRGVKTGIKEILKGVVSRRAIPSLAIGAGYGATGAVQEGETRLKEIAKKAAIAAPFALAAQVGLESVGAAGGKILSKLKKPSAKIEAKVLPEVEKAIPKTTTEIKLPISKNLEPLAATKGAETVGKLPSAPAEVFKPKSASGKLPSTPAEALPTTPPKVIREPLVKTVGAAASVRTKAIRDKLIYGFDRSFRDLPDYDVMKIPEQAIKATDLVLNNTETAVKIAMGDIPAPEGLYPESVFVALDKYATETKNVDLIRKLATQSKITGEGTMMGQRIRLWGELNPDSPTKIISDIQETRIGAKGGKPKIQSTVENEKNKLVSLSKSETIKGSTQWSKIIEQLRC